MLARKVTIPFRKVLMTSVVNAQGREWRIRAGCLDPCNQRLRNDGKSRYASMRCGYQMPVCKSEGIGFEATRHDILATLIQAVWRDC